MGRGEGPSGDGLRTTSLRGRGLAVCDDKPTFWDKAAAGTWEPELLEAFEQLIRPGDTVLDIGAWVGPTSLFAALLGARVVSVEADPRAAELLRGNIAANPGLAGRMTVVERAAAAVAGPISLAAPRKPGDSMSSVLLGARDGGWTVQAVTPAELLDLARPSGDGALLVKVDIEGGEYDLIPALVPALPPGRVRGLIVAFHPGLLQVAGRASFEVDAANAACFAALQGWGSQVLEMPGQRQADAMARERNVTVVFREPT